MTQNIAFTDKLKDRGFIDQWGFLIFCVLGFSGIIVAKHLTLDVVWVAMGACLTMLLYAMIIGRAGTGRLRADQAGDNCYYLGLIYTLASLSHAIFTFDPDNTAGTIVQGFGIALATTILGLVLRVFFSQGRPDMENIEQQVRLEFMEATSQLKSELSAVVQNTNDMSRQLQQSMQEIHTTARASISTFAEQTLAEIQAVTAEATSAIGTQSKDFVARSKRYSTSIDSLVTQLERHSETLSAVNDSQQAFARTTQNIHAATEAMSLSVVTFSQGIDATNQSAVFVANTTCAAATQLLSSIEWMDSGIKLVISEINQQLIELKNSPAQSVTAAAQAASKVCEQLTIQGESALSITRAHNQALAEELARSREMVNKVHSALVDMTGSLANKLEEAT